MLGGLVNGGASRIVGATCASAGKRRAAMAAHGTGGSTVKEPRVVNGVHDFVSEYKGILLDQFGVLHDGRKPYPGAIGAVQSLYENGLRIILVSNSGR